MKNIFEIDYQHLSQLTFKDAQIFENIKVNTNSEYSSSWLYTLRSSMFETSKLGYKYYHNNIFFTIGLRGNNIYIGRIFGLEPRNYSEVLELIQYLKRIHSGKIVIKKANKNVAEMLMRNRIPFSLSVDNEKDDTIFEDETYPEKVIMLKKILKQSKKDLIIGNKKFRKGVNRFLNIGLNVKEIDIFSNNSDFSLDDLQRGLHYLSRGNSNKYVSYTKIIEYLYINIDDVFVKNKYIFKVYIVNGTIEGMYILEKLNTNKVGFYCGLTSIKWGGITEYLDYLIFCELFRLKLYTVYLGGSESQGIANYVEKLLPLNKHTTSIPIILA